MVKELNEYLESNMLDDYWYDDAIFVCQDIIKEFSIDDWIELKRNILQKDTRWNVRLAECLGDIDSEEAITCLKEIMLRGEQEIFIACIDALRDKNITLNSIEGFKDIINRAKEISVDASMPVKMVLNDFIKKCELNS